MSFIGQSPRVKRVRYEPQAADPSNPAEGDFFYSDGTSRAEGLWIYTDGAWDAVGRDYSISTEVAMKDYFEVRVASTANLTLASDVDNGSIIDGITLVTGDYVLLKDQSTSSDNGVYVVQASGAPVRHTDADSAAELSYFSASVTRGTTNANTTWFQNNLLTDITDAQSWASTISAIDYVVPTGVSQMIVVAAGAGGGGGGGGIGTITGSSSTRTAGGGGGGAGAPVVTSFITVTPGETISVQLGKGGLRATGATVGNVRAASGLDGGNTTITGTFGTLTYYGGEKGQGGVGNLAGQGAGGDTSTVGSARHVSSSVVAEGGDGGYTSGTTAILAQTGYSNDSNAGGAAGATVQNVGGIADVDGSGGGGGGASIGIGGAGGDGQANTNYDPDVPTVAGGKGEDANKGAGGGGGGGIAETSGSVILGGTSGHGGCGYVKFIY